MFGHGCRQCRIGGFGPGRCTACRRPKSGTPSGSSAVTWEARVSLTVASTSRGGLGRTGKGLVIVQSQVIAEPHEAGHGGYPTRREQRFGETAGGQVVFSTKLERPHHGRVKVHRRPLVIHLDRRFSILGGGPRRRHFAIIRGILLCRAPCALARGFCCFGQPKRARPRRNNKRDVLEGGERQWQTQRTLQTWQS